MPLISIENEVDPWIDAFVAHATELRNAIAPLRRVISKDVVAFSRQRIHSSHAHVRVCARQLHLDGIYLHSGIDRVRGMLWIGRQAENRTFGTEKNAVSGASGHIFCTGIVRVEIALSLIRFEDQREAAQKRKGLGLSI